MPCNYHTIHVTECTVCEYSRQRERMAAATPTTPTVTYTTATPVTEALKGFKTETGGTKHDSNKPRMELLSGIWLAGVATVMGFGAVKYDAHNWRKGIKASRLLGAALRHIFAYLSGEDKDPESGVSHLYHASCCLMFASELAVTRPDLDDRYKKEST